jgi:hypothetical protein
MLAKGIEFHETKRHCKPVSNPPMVAFKTRRHNFPSGCVRISKRSSIKKTLDLRRQQAKKLIQGYFSGRTLITSRKVSIYCGITFLEVVLKKKNPY